MILRDNAHPLGIELGPSYARSQSRRGAAIPAVTASNGISPDVRGVTRQQGRRRSPWRDDSRKGRR